MPAWVRVMLSSLLQHWIKLLDEVLELPLQFSLVLNLLFIDHALVLDERFMAELSEFLKADTKLLMVMGLL